MLVMCEYDDGFQEPEGTVIFDSLHPPIGTKVILSDKKEWIVVKDNMDNECNPHIVCKKLKVKDGR